MRDVDGADGASERPTHAIKLIAYDMDGTLLTEQSQVTEPTRRAICALSERGVLCVLVSGRMVASLLPYHEELGLTTPVIAYNGAMVYDVVRRELIEHTPVDYDAVKEVLAWGHQAQLHIQYFWDDRFWSTSRNEWLEVYETRTRLTASMSDGFDEFGPDRLPTKLQFIMDPAEVPDQVSRLREHFGSRLYVTNTLPEYVEMMHPDVSKGRSLGRLGQRLGVETRNMLAFGDAQNDETMFDAVGFAVVMGNARDSVKQKASFITKSHEEDGVVYALETLGLLPRGG